MTDFQPWPKIPRTDKIRWYVTEKIDGTNAQIYIRELDSSEVFHPESIKVVTEGIQYADGSLPRRVYEVFAGSRKRWVIPTDDNHGFARWVQQNALELVAVLGPGRHYGEWWGDGIQKNPLGLAPGERRFSLFNTSRRDWLYSQAELHKVDLAALGVDTVPLLAHPQSYFEDARYAALPTLEASGGSVASPGHAAEGLVFFESGSNTYYKEIFGSTGPKGAQ